MAFSGITMDSLDDALTFLQGFVACLFFLGPKDYVDGYMEKVTGLGPIDPYYRMKLIVKQWLGFELEDKNIDHWFDEEAQKVTPKT